jgi:hypothetical protein
LLIVLVACSQRREATEKAVRGFCREQSWELRLQIEHYAAHGAFMPMYEGWTYFRQILSEGHFCASVRGQSPTVDGLKQSLRVAVVDASRAISGRDQAKTVAALNRVLEILDEINGYPLR